MRGAPSLPTPSELLILRVLWRRGPSTVREVQTTLEQDRPTGYTTVLKLLQIMFEKGLVLRDESARTHIYRARSTEQQTRRQLLRDLVDRAFDGSSTALITEAVAVKPPTPEEAARLRQLLRGTEDPAASSTTAGRTRSTSDTKEDEADPPGPGRLF